MSNNFNSSKLGIIDGWRVATTVSSLVEADVGTAACTAGATSELGTGDAVLDGTTTIFCVETAGAAEALVAVLVDATLPTLVLGAVVGA